MLDIMAYICNVAVTALFVFCLPSFSLPQYGNRIAQDGQLTNLNYGDHQLVLVDEGSLSDRKHLRIQPSRPWTYNPIFRGTKAFSDSKNTYKVERNIFAKDKNILNQGNIISTKGLDLHKINENSRNIFDTDGRDVLSFNNFQSQRQFNYRVELQVQLFLKPSRKMFDNLLGIISKLFGDEDASYIVPLSYRIAESTLLFTWGNTTLDYPLCSKDIVNHLSDVLFEGNSSSVKKIVIDAFLPYFVLKNMKEERSGLCSNNSNAELQMTLLEVIFHGGHQFKIHRQRQRRSTMDGTSPKLNASLGPFNATYCALFFEPVPENTFSDNEDGNTRNLSLSLHYSNGSAVDLTSWLQLDQNLQTLYGYLKVSDDALADNEKRFTYKLRATDSSGLSVDAPFIIKIPDQLPIIYFRMDLVVNSFEHTGKPDVNEAMFLAYKVFSFFDETSFSNINILSFEKDESKDHTKDSITFGWTNCSIAANQACPVQLVDSIISKVIMPDGTPNPSFASRLQPQFNIAELRAKKVGICTAVNSSVLLQPTPTPVYNLSPIIMVAIPQITVSTTMYFSYQIPGDTFYDTVDGYTRSLYLELRTANNVSITTSSWLQFERATQTLYGILTTNLFAGTYIKYFSYMLIAINSRGYRTEMLLTMKGQRQALSFGAMFLLSGRDNSPSLTSDVVILSSTLQKLRSYVNDARNNTIEVVSFERKITGQQRIFSLAYYNTTITTNNCLGLAKLIPLLKNEGALINQGLTIALVPDLVADRIDITGYGNCSLFFNNTVAPSPIPSGMFPTVVNKVPIISIKTGIFFEIIIPKDTFYDTNDGDTTKLTLQVTEINGNALSRDSWIQFDAAKQSLYGLLPSSQQSLRPFQNFTFLLQARNSQGHSAIQVITIQSEFTNVNVGVVVTFNGRDIISNQWNSVQLQNFMLTQLRSFFGVMSNDTIQILSFEHQATGGSQFTTMWTDSRIASTGCDLTLLRNLEARLFSSGDTLNPSLISRMLPNVVLIDAKITYYGQCLQNGSLNSPNYTNILPLFTVNAGDLFTYQIPRNTFMDNVDGDTRSLQLTLKHNDGSTINASSSVQFNSSNQALSGIFFDTDIQGSTEKLFSYILTASNSRNYKTSVFLSIRAQLNADMRGVIVFTLANTFYTQQTSQLQQALDFLQGLSSYIQPSKATDFSIISSTRTSGMLQQASVTWSYNKINGVTCNRTRLNEFQDLLNTRDGQPNQEFVRAMSPTFIVFATTIQTLNNCNDSFSMVAMPPKSSYKAFIPSTQLRMSSMSIINTNHPPTVTSKILPLFAYFCIPFSYQIPSDLFNDKEQGDTRYLRVHLETQDRQPVGTDSWLQFSESSQVLYGILKIEDFNRKPEGGYRYFLVATDNKGEKAATDFTITIPESPVRYNHLVTMNLNRIFDDSVPDVNEQLLISTKILEFFADANSNYLNIISYERQTGSRAAVIKWSNCSLQFTPCPTTELNSVLRKLTDSSGSITESFRNAMLSHYTINSLTTEKLSPCNISIHSSAVPISASILPTPSIPVYAPPLLQNRIGQLNITWCAPFRFQVPADMFFDANEGMTRNLSLELLHLNGSQLSINYWVRFNQVTQTILAYPTVRDVNQHDINQFVLVAKNSKIQNASQVVSVKVTKSKPNPIHQLQVTASAYLTTQMYDVDIRILIYSKMKSYFQSNQTEIISFSSYEKTGQSPSFLLFTFSNCSLTENACDRSDLDSMLGKIFAAPGVINSDFIIAFGPEIVVTDIKVDSLGICSSAMPAPFSIQSTAHEALSTSVSIAPKNQRPLVLQSIGALAVAACSLFTFTVPERAFYDIEDGLTRNLKLTVTNADGSAVKNDSWLSFDSITQQFKGVITNEDAKDWHYVLIATDKGGLSVSQTVQFRVEGDSDPIILVVNTTFTNYLHPTTPRPDVLEYFMNKLVAYLSDMQRISIRILSFKQSLGTKSQLNISWTICNVKDECNVTFTRELQQKLFYRDAIINPNLSIALGPSLMVDRLQIQNIVSCTATPAVQLTTFPVPSAVSSSLPYNTIVYSSTVSPNSPPVFNKNLPTLQVSLCSPFSMRLPDDLCSDPEDNATTITITYKNGSSLTSTSLLQFNKENQTVYGMIIETDVLPSGQLKSQFVIQCEDTKGLKMTKELEINVTESSEKQNGYALTIQAYLYSVSSLPNVDIQLLWIRKLRSYLQHPAGNNLFFIHFKRISSIQAEFSFRLCNLDVCNSTALSYVRDKIFSTIPNLNPQFIVAMIPEFSLVSSSLQAPSVNVCPILSTFASPTPLISSSVYNTPVYNTPVKTLRSLPVINVTLCGTFEYMIPYDTFFDQEDGYTSNLTVSLHHDDNSPVNPASFVQYDNTKLTIRGYIVQELTVMTSLLRYKLIAQDSRGSLASLPVYIRSIPTYKTVNHSFTTEAQLYGSFKDNVAIMAEIASKVRAYFGVRFNKGMFFVNFTKHDFQTPLIVFTWGSCALLESCDQTSLKYISDRLLFSGTIINFEFISALAPNILVSKITQSTSTNCPNTEESPAVKTLPLTTVTSFFLVSSLASSLVTSSSIESPSMLSSAMASSPMPSSAMVSSAMTSSAMASSAMTSSALASVMTYTPSTSLSALSSESISPSSAYSLPTSMTNPSTPVVLNAIPPVITTLCSLLVFQIPEDTFYDATDGYTRNLTLSGRLVDQHSIPDGFWISFNSASQKLDGQANVDSLNNQPEQGYFIVIRAKNKRNYFVETTVVVKIKANISNINHNITFAFEELGLPFTTDFDAISFIRNKINVYFGDSKAENIGVINYQRNSTVTSLTWYNCSIADTICNRENIEQYLSSMVHGNGSINSDFSTLFRPRYQLKSIKALVSDNCHQMTSSTYSLPDSVIVNTPRLSSTFIQLVDNTSAPNAIRSTSSAKHLASSNIIVGNSAPVALDIVNVSLPYCGSIRFKLSNDTFYDKEDGGAYNLKLRLLSTTGERVGCNSTVRLNETTKELYGGVVLAKWKTPMTYQLEAEDKQGLTATTTVILKIPTEPKYSTFVVTFEAKLSSNICLADAIEHVYNVLEHHLQIANTSIISYEANDRNDSLKIMWTDCSLLENHCNANRSAAVRELVVKNNTINHKLMTMMSPYMDIQTTTIFSSELCDNPSLLYVNVTLCNQLTLTDRSFNSTIYDIQAQKLRTLAYKVHDKNGKILPWIIYDNKTRSIRLMPVAAELKSRPTTELVLNAEYGSKLVRSLEIVLIHPELRNTQFNYSISMKLVSYKPLTLNDIDLLDAILERMSNFSTSWLIIDYNRSKSYPETVHVSLAPCFVTTECNDTRMDRLTSELSLGNGIPSYSAVQAMWPNFELLDLKVSRIGSCGNNIPRNSTASLNITVALCTKLFSPMKDSMIATGLNKTSGLTYDLKNADGSKVTLQSWVQFDTVNNSLYGVPTQQDLIDQPDGGYQYLLQIQDNSGSTIYVPVNITIIGNKTKPAYSLTILFTRTAQYRESVADVLLDVRSKLGKLFANVSEDSIGLISYQSSFDLSKLSRIEFTNCSILTSQGKCDASSVDLLSREANGQPSNEMIASFGSNYTIIKIIETKTPTCGNSSNSVPTVNNSLPSLNASICAKLDYDIPDDTFFDKEDGNVSSLVLLLKAANGATLQQTSWIQLDSSSKVIYGIPTYDVIRNEPISGYSFLLEAQDNRGGLASLTFQVNLNDSLKDRSTVNILMNTSLPKTASVLEIQRMFLQKTEACLNASMQSIAIAHYRQIGSSGQQINVSIFSNCSYFDGVCDKVEVNRFIKSFTENGTVNVAYKACMSPQFFIIHVDMSLSKLCTNITTNNPPLVARYLPQLNLTYCRVLYYKVPNNTFIDMEDGQSILDSAELRKLNGEPIEATELVQYDRQTRTIYALSSQSHARNNTIYEYILQVNDTGGKTARANVTVKSNQTARTFTYKVCLSLRMYTTAIQNDIDVIINLLKRIEYYLSNGRVDGSLTAINYSLTETFPRTVQLCFSNCSFVDGACMKGEVEAIKQRLIVGNNFATLQFKQALNPDFTVLNVVDDYAEHCQVNPTRTTALPSSFVSVTSYIVPTPISLCLNGQNTVPKVINSVGTLTVQVGLPTYYDIQSDVVYDIEDGFLKILQLTDMVGKEIDENWVYFDFLKQRVYLSVFEGDFKGEKSLRVIAKDSCGATVYDVLKINIAGSVSCCYTIQLKSYTSYSAFRPNVTMQYLLHKRLMDIYNDTAGYIRFHSISNEMGNTTGLSYTNSSFTNESCQYYQTRQLSVVAFHENGSVRNEFIDGLSAYRVFDAAVNNKSHCNGSLIIVPPIITTLPGTTDALTYNDWLWYMLPFIILAFLVACCCLLFYWCKACRETCCGKKKDEGLFTAAGSQPIQQEILPKTGKGYQEEDPVIAAQAAAAARPQDGTISEELYADIGADSSVPPMHKDRRPPPWMVRSPKSVGAAAAPIPAVDEPLIQGTAAVPQEAALDSIDAPIATMGVAAQPRRRASEVPIMASHIDSVHRRPSYLVTPSTSAVSVEENPLTQSLAPTFQAGQPPPERRRVDEDEISPIDRETLEAALPLNHSMDPSFALAAPVNETPIEQGLQPLFEGPASASGPVLRLPSTPILPIGEAPPPYSPPKIRKVMMQPQHNRGGIDLSKRRAIFVPRGVRLQRMREPVATVESMPFSKSRLRSVPHYMDTSVKYTVPKEKKLRPRLIRKTVSRPIRQRSDPVYSLHGRDEPIVIDTSPLSIKRYRSVGLRKSPLLSNYFSESETDVTSLEEYDKPKMPTYGSRELLDVSDDDSEVASEKQVPVEINGIVNAPESVLMKWMRDGSLKTTITNVSPAFERKKRKKEPASYHILSPNAIKKRRRRKRKHEMLPYDQASIQFGDEKPALLLTKSPSKDRRRSTRRYTASPKIYLNNDMPLSDHALSHDRGHERSLKRGYPYSRDPYEYVETAMRPKHAATGLKERTDRNISSNTEVGHRVARIQGRNKPRRSISEILARMTRRKDLKKKREVFENSEIFPL